MKLTSKPDTFRKVLSKLTALLIILLPTSAYAADCTTTPGSVWPTCINQKDEILVLINKVIAALLTVVGAITVLFIILGGFQYITSAGNMEQTQKAKKTLLYAVIGLVTVIISYAIVNFIISSLK